MTLWQRFVVAGALSLAFTLSACDAPTDRAEPEASESARLAAFFEDSFERDLARSPMRQTVLGRKTDYDKWDDLSDAKAIEDIALVRQDLERLHSEFDIDRLDPAARLSYRLFEYEAERKLADFEFRFHNYPINQMRGWQSRIPAFLINFHRIDSEADAKAYIARLNGVAGLMDQIIDGLEMRAQKGIVPPAFVFAHALRDSENMLRGAPFDDSGTDSALLADFRAKVATLKIDAASRQRLVDGATAALETAVAPAYRKLIAYLRELQQQAKGNNGVWALPDGARFYRQRLKDMTTTDLSADEIHEYGLAEVARIQDEMRAIMARVGFAGSLRDFFTFMRTDPRFYLPDDEQGRTAYLERTKAVIAAMKAKLPTVFAHTPKADLVVKRVEAFREKSAGRAFYWMPAPDGSRPGVYYVNLSDMSAMPTYGIEALAFHEGLPGHHMQRALQIEQTDLPSFRKFAGFTAYTEGWGLYAEYLAKEIGFYDDPYSDFGRLAGELWRATRLVVDTGIHARRWSREKAIKYLVANTPYSESDATKAIERYFVMPGQATAYKIGMRKILELRETARRRLGERFDIREFHDVVLSGGPMPLSMLEEVVNAWIETKAA